MARPVVVTFLGTLACAGASKPVPSSNPPPPEPAEAAPSPAPEVVTTAPPGEHDRSRFTRVLNPDHVDHGRIYRATDGTCYVHLPFEAGEGPPVSFRPPPRGPVDCPEFMTDPSWDACAQGTFTTTEDGDACLCSVMGNPPPPPRPVECPKTQG